VGSERSRRPRPVIESAGLVVGVVCAALLVVVLVQVRGARQDWDMTSEGIRSATPHAASVELSGTVPLSDGGSLAVRAIVVQRTGETDEAVAGRALRKIEALIREAKREDG